MGVIQKILATAEFKNNKSEFLEIELNQGNIIHFQNDVFRIEMNLPEFVEFSSHVITGANKLIESKNINVDKILDE
tara:strand:- start:14 stop:241 length:228 start_codon:yes stop_codon:yes gene_type:complete